MTDTPAGILQTQGRHIVDRNGTPVRLRGVAVGGWLNMENFITGYSANESLMRATVREVLGEPRYELFFERLLTAFFGEDDARFLPAGGRRCRHLIAPAARPRSKKRCRNR